jgi:hypothetical protein
VHEKDDLRDYRHGSAASTRQSKATSLRRPDPSEEQRRERYAEAIARAEFGRFYWNEKRRRDLDVAMRRRRQQRPSNGKSRR